MKFLKEIVFYNEELSCKNRKNKGKTRFLKCSQLKIDLFLEGAKNCPPHIVFRFGGKLRFWIRKEFVELLKTKKKIRFNYKVFF
jgi:hypothetical protein